MATETATVGPYNAAAAAGKEDPTRPLAVASPTVHPEVTDGAGDEEVATTRRWRSMQYLRKRRCAIWCCGCCATTVVLLGIAALVLALTVFKVKDPVLTMNRVTLEGVDGDLGTERHPVSVNATLSADISIKNPNVASFRFARSETDFYYAGETVGVAYAPDGEVGADRTVRMNVTLDVLADRISPNVNATDLIFGQDYNLTSYTEITGRVNVLGIYKRDLDIKMNCSITLEVGAFTTVQSKSTNCVANVS
ncbi:hypothetical protein SEVIR_5G312300v4 [Setaria viridis]|uniref:Late embryogenesis abundant protein LEA-2 subgroup domain-containing protein n=2 Tax=Setaria TaxID=4554 RepID=K3XL97_SETIT|nr:uncharacterized protein LOC101774891 [Setaria italica]XP_034593794.1 uncharacterized protein LOC117855525 [Setaria viridis]RCV27247.1 hypothetical protein SETIT_5G309600v2 [Setaria italica]TKW16635.1 hypothetical protein SEVIR_5G312300v2 [Setaria viridis]